MNRRHALSLLVLLLAAGGAAAEPRIDLVWTDPYSLVPRADRGALRDEIDRFGACTGIPLRLIFAERDAPLPPAGPARIHVHLRPGDGRHWGLEEEAMAAAIGQRGGTYAIFIFVDEIRRTLGHVARRASPRARAELRRGLARVLEHELVHVLAPDRGHAGTGLMSRRLTRKLLLSRGIELDLTSLVRARDGVFRLTAMRMENVSGQPAAEVVAIEAPPPSR